MKAHKAHVEGELHTGADEDGHVLYNDDLSEAIAECCSEREVGADAADAAELARRWNAHEGLLAALKDMVCAGCGRVVGDSRPDLPHHSPCACCAAARAAIKAARPEGQ